MFSIGFTNFHGSLNFITFLFFSTTVLLLTFYYYQTSYHDKLVAYPTSLYFNKNYKDSAIREEDVENGYVVWSSTCRIMNIQPFHESIKKFVFKYQPISCSVRKPLTYTRYNFSSQRHSILIDKTASSDYVSGEWNIQCCYSPIRRLNDEIYKLDESVCFHDQIELQKEIEFLYVECSSNSVIYRTVHGVVANKVEKTKPSGLKNYSVLLLGIDSVSRLNLIRSMPKTWQYLQKNQWITLEGYTKVGHNTLPNLSALLSGLSYDDLKKTCWKSDDDVFDSCPFVWKNYKNRSYVTAYIEDSPEINTFNYEKRGFAEVPTDYYIRPLLLAAHHLLPIKEDGKRAFCVGESTQAEYGFKYTTEFVQRYQNEAYFNLFWLNSFSHDELNQPQLMDERYRQFLQELEPYLNSTIVIFFSDHGFRFGEIRETFVGWLEERMPYLTFHLPTSFKQNYPEKYKNLIYNKNRLTSPFDIYVTLLDILGDIRKPASCPTCDTLFNKVPVNRTCDEAGIPSTWCTCSSNSEDVLTTDPVSLSGVNYVINEINKYVIARNKTVAGTTCAVLSLKRIISVRILTSFSRFMFSRPNLYVIVFETDPSRGVFEANLQPGRDFSIDSVSRINSYGNQSSCVVRDSVLMNYCFCIRDT